MEFGDAPDQQGNAHPILGEGRRHRLAQEGSGLTGDLKAPVDRVIVGEGDEIHPGAAELGEEFFRLRNTCRNLQTTEQPLGGAKTVSGVKMEIGAGHDSGLPSLMTA